MMTPEKLELIRALSRDAWSAELIDEIEALQALVALKVAALETQKALNIQAFKERDALKAENESSLKEIESLKTQLLEYGYLVEFRNELILSHQYSMDENQKLRERIKALRHELEKYCYTTPWGTADRVMEKDDEDAKSS